MRESNKERLFDAAFKLMLASSIGEISLADVERASGLSKGAIFYYASNKMDFFRKVIESRIIQRQDIHKKVAYQEGMSLLSFIDAYIDGINRTRAAYGQAIGQMPDTNTVNSYITIILQSRKYYPDLADAYVAILQGERDLWEKVLNDAIQSGEIRADVDVRTMAATFQDIFYGRVYATTLVAPMDTDALANQMKTLYKLLK